MSEAILAVLGVAFAAFVVWPAVRIVNRQERWAKRTAVVLAIPVLYLLSTGPVIWLLIHGWMPTWMQEPVDWIYWPFDLVLHKAPDPIRDPLFWYIELWGW